jgi:hypothetical protein
MDVSSESIAGVGVADRQHEQAEAEGQQNEIKHEQLLSKHDALERLSS